MEPDQAVFDPGDTVNLVVTVKRDDDEESDGADSEALAIFNQPVSA